MQVVQSLADAVMADGPLVLVDQYAKWFTDDFEWRPALIESVEGRTFRGESGFREYWEEFLEAFTDVSVVDAKLEAVDDTTVLVTGIVRGRGAGSGIPIDREVAYLFETRGRRITAGRTFFTPGEAREFLANA
jgi:ketosteroid isomerase-like protein